MARHGSEKRQRTQQICVRFTPEEAALVRQLADRADVSMAALIRYALLDQIPLRASPQLSLAKQDAAQLLGMLGPLREALLQADVADNARISDALIEAACRDIADMRTALMVALGHSP